MSNELVAVGNSGGEIMERVMMVGDLSKLQPQERVQYYNAVCQSLGLNPLTRPFDYISLQGKLTLYARKDATEQLRKMHGVSIERLEHEQVGDLYVATAYARMADGRTDSDMGAVNITSLKGEALANAMMKAVTKAKRRATLSICGLGWLDETEIDSIPQARPVGIDSDGVIISHDAHDPVSPGGLFRPGDSVVVHGKNDEKPGVVKAVNGLITVDVDGQELKVSAEKLTLVEMA